MSKRRLTLQQQRRIQEKRLRETIDPAEQLLTDEQLGVEQTGVLYARYGQQADIIDPQQPSRPPKRCYLRANLGSPVTGDRVVWRNGEPYGVITALMPRQSVLERPDHNNQPRAIAANIDLVCVVIAPEPEPHGNLIDRFLVAARLQDLDAIVVVNKTDLTTPHSGEIESLTRLYRKLNYEVYPVSAETGQGVAELAERLSGHYCILAGQSGVGKSSLINQLFPGFSIRVGELSTQKRKGKHTTTASHLYLLPEGGGVIDSPGIREFGLSHLPSRNLIEGFVELRPLLGQCQFRDCRHSQDPGCAILAAAERGDIDPRRLASLRHMEQAELQA